MRLLRSFVAAVAELVLSESEVLPCLARPEVFVVELVLSESEVLLAWLKPKPSQ